MEMIKETILKELNESSFNSTCRTGAYISFQDVIEYLTLSSNGNLIETVLGKCGSKMIEYPRECWKTIDYYYEISWINKNDKKVKIINE